jgi:hypothetical protein
MMAFEDEMLAREAAGGAEASAPSGSESEAAPPLRGALAGPPSDGGGRPTGVLVTAASLASAGSVPTPQPVPGAAAPAAQLALEAFLLRGESGGAALDELRAEAAAGGTSGTVEPAGSDGHSPAQSTHSQDLAFTLGGGGLAAAGDQAPGGVAAAGGADAADSCSMPQALSCGPDSASMPLAPSELASASMAQAPSLPAAGALEPQISTAATSGFAAALEAETGPSPVGGLHFALQTVAEMDVDAAGTPLSAQQEAEHEQNGCSAPPATGAGADGADGSGATGQQIKRSSSRQTAGVKKPWK